MLSCPVLTPSSVATFDSPLLNIVQECLGRPELMTAAIYANAVGEGEQTRASRRWGGPGTAEGQNA